MEGKFRYLWLEDLLTDQRLMDGFGNTPKDSQSALEDAIDQAVSRGTLLSVEVQIEGTKVTAYFLNSPRGRTAAQAIQRGHWQPTKGGHPPFELSQEPLNIFQLYEQHIGPLSPMIADALQEAEDTYPSVWIEEAFRIAVENNVRRWRYVEAILTAWQEEGRDERGVRGDSEKDRHRYIRGKFSEFVEH
jgi:DnaD/phage-associated family protein